MSTKWCKDLGEGRRGIGLYQYEEMASILWKGGVDMGVLETLSAHDTLIIETDLYEHV